MQFSGRYPVLPDDDRPDEEQARRLAARYLGQGPEALDAHALRAFATPRRIFLSCSYSDLRGFSALCDLLSPEELRSLLDQCLAGITGAVDAVDGFIDTIDGNGVLAAYGVLERHADHALRAVQAAVMQQHDLRRIRGDWRRSGRRVPAGGIAVHSEEMVVSPIGPQRHRRYSVLGEGVGLTGRLCGLAQPDEVLCTEATVAAVLAELPAGWRQEQYNEEALPLAAFAAVRAPLHELDEDRAGRVVVIGPGRQERLRFRWLYAIEVHGLGERLPVVAVEGGPAGDLSLSTSLSEEAPQLERRIGRYRLIEALGHGGMGEVWKGLDPAGEVVAVKTLLAGDQAGEDRIERFRREAEVMARLNHPNICRLYDVGDHGNLTYIAMEHVEGVSLEEILEGPADASSTATGSEDLISLATQAHADRAQRSEITTLPPSRDGSAPQEDEAQADDQETGLAPERFRQLHVEQALSIVLAVADAVGHAHEIGILHRDLKPGNIMIDLSGRVVVMDFGLAKIRDETDRQLSLSGQFLGTLCNMAPEQASSAKDVDERADVYALGTVLFECLAGERHFRSSGNLADDIARLRNHTPKAIRRLRPDVHPELALVLAKALANHSGDRYQSMRQFQEDLQRYRRGETVHAQPPSAFLQLRRWAERNRSASRIAAVAGLLMVLGTMWSLWHLDLRRREAEEARHSAEQAKRAAEQTLADLRSARLAQQQAEAQNEALEAEFERNWQTVYHETFDDPEQVWQHWRLLPKGIEAELANGRLEVTSGRGTFLAFRHPITGPVRLSFDVVITGGTLDDVSCFMNVPNAWLEGVHHHSALPIGGYEFKYGGYTNTRNEIKRRSHLLRTSLDSPLMIGGRYRMVAERNGSRLRFWIDDELILEATDPDPIVDPQAGILGISTWFAQVRWDNIRIERLGLPRKVDMLDLAETMAEEGAAEGAREVYRHAQRNAMDREQLLRATAGIEAADVMLERKALAVEYTRRLHEAWPQHEASVDYHRGELICHLSDLPLPSLEALRGMRIQRLFLNDNGTPDLGPLRGMPLLEFTCNGNGVRDLAPLTGMPIEQLNLIGNQIVDLEPLRGMPLRVCSLSSNRITDLSPLQGMPLEEFEALGNAIRDLAPLGDMPLRRLILVGNRIDDIGPLASLTRLKRLRIDDNTIRDIEPLRGKQLSEFDCSRNPIERLDGLDASLLLNCDLSHTRVDDLAPLAGSVLNTLSLAHTPVSDLSPLRGLPLSTIDLRETRITDIEALRGMRLRRVELTGTAVTDLAPLESMAISHLDISHTPVADLSPLAISSLNLLACEGCPIDDHSFAPLDARAGALVLRTHGSGLSARRLRRLAALWQPAPKLQRDYHSLAALAADDLEALRELAIGLGDRRVLPLPVRCTRQEAVQLCRRLGGRLAQPRSQEEIETMAALLHGFSSDCWITANPALAADHVPHIDDLALLAGGHRPGQRFRTSDDILSDVLIAWDE